MSSEPLNVRKNVDTVLMIYDLRLGKAEGDSWPVELNAGYITLPCYVVTISIKAQVTYAWSSTITMGQLVRYVSYIYYISVEYSSACAWDSSKIRTEFCDLFTENAEESRTLQISIGTALDDFAYFRLCRNRVRGAPIVLISVESLSRN